MVGSDAVDFGSGAARPPTDQRGYGRGVDGNEPLRLNGCDVGRGDLLVVRPGEELDFVTPPGLEFFHCHLSPHTATRISEQVDANFGATRIVRQRGELWSAFGASVRAWLEEPDPNSLTGNPRPSTRTRSMLESVTQVLADPEPEVSRPGRAPAGNTRVAQAARDLMAETQAEPVTTSELCGALGVSKRTLETAFRHRFGLSPIAYHHRLRMHAARRDLIRAQPGEVQVGAIALRHGFEHLGRFSVDYKALFAESPSRTLSR